MTDVPGKRVWGRWPQRVQGGALVFPLDYINKKGQGVTRSVLRTTPWTRWARHAKRALARRAQTSFTYVSFLTRVVEVDGPTVLESFVLNFDPDCGKMGRYSIDYSSRNCGLSNTGLWKR